MLVKLCEFADGVIMSFPTHLVDRLHDVESAEDEILILADLLFAINSSADSTIHKDNLEQLVEGQMFESSAEQKTLLSKTGLYIDDNCSYANSLNYLVAYIFERRFGWSESDLSGVIVSDGGQHRVSVVRRSTVGGNVDISKSLVEDLRCKSRINEALDKLITWYFKTALCLCAFCSVLVLLNSQMDFVMPVVMLMNNF